MTQSRSFGIMFHHFFSEVHPKGQGAISADNLDEMLAHLKKTYTILNAHDYQERMKSGQVLDSEICLTFDDALLCQIDVALPVLAAHGIEAFFFVYSSIFNGETDPLEIYRYFRTTKFQSFEDFYPTFEREATNLYPDLVSDALSVFNHDEYLSEFPFYTVHDKQFRYLRNEILEGKKYEHIMDAMMTKLKFDSKTAAESVYMTRSHLLDLNVKGHVVGLHSHNHPTMLHTKSESQQASEYRENFDFISNLLGSKPTSMSHPCGNYNDATLKILRELDVELGFRSNMKQPTVRTALEIPREDHSNIMNELKI